MTDGHHFRSAQHSIGLRVLLVTGAPAWPDADGSHDFDIFGVGDAIVSLARATFAAGGEIISAVDAGTNLVLAAVALDYMPQRAAEVHDDGRRRLVTAVETAGVDEELRQVLAPYQERGVVQLFGPDGERIEPDPEWSRHELRPPEAPAHPVTQQLVERWRPHLAVFVAPDRASERAMAMLSELNVPFNVIGPTAADRAVAERCVVVTTSRNGSTGRRTRLAVRRRRRCPIRS
jgi:hypothetical protein